MVIMVLIVPWETHEQQDFFQKCIPHVLEGSSALKLTAGLEWVLALFLSQALAIIALRGDHHMQRSCVPPTPPVLENDHVLIPSCLAMLIEVGNDSDREMSNSKNIIGCNHRPRNGFTHDRLKQK